MAAYHQQKDPLYTGSNSKRYDPNTTFNWYYSTDAIASTTYRKDLQAQRRRRPDDPAAAWRTTAPRWRRAPSTPAAVAFGVSVDQSWHSDEARNQDRTAGHPINGSNGQPARDALVRPARPRRQHHPRRLPRSPRTTSATAATRRTAAATSTTRTTSTSCSTSSPSRDPARPTTAVASGSSNGGVLDLVGRKQGRQPRRLRRLPQRRRQRHLSRRSPAPCSRATSFNDVEPRRRPDRVLPRRRRRLPRHGRRRLLDRQRHALLLADRPRRRRLARRDRDGVRPRRRSRGATTATTKTGFRIERANGGGGGAFASDRYRSPPTQTGYTDTTAQARMTYRYRVVAYNAVGDAAASNVAHRRHARQRRPRRRPVRPDRDRRPLQPRRPGLDRQQRQRGRLPRRTPPRRLGLEQRLERAVVTLPVEHDLATPTRPSPRAASATNTASSPSPPSPTVVDGASRQRLPRPPTRATSAPRPA